MKLADVLGLMYITYNILVKVESLLVGGGQQPLLQHGLAAVVRQLRGNRSERSDCSALSYLEIVDAGVDRWEASVSSVNLAHDGEPDEATGIKIEGKK